MLHVLTQTSKWCSLPWHDKTIGTVYCQWITTLEWFTCSIIQRPFTLKRYKPQTYCVNHVVSLMNWGVHWYLHFDTNQLFKLPWHVDIWLLTYLHGKQAFPVHALSGGNWGNRRLPMFKSHQSIEKKQEKRKAFITQTVYDDIKRVHITQLKISLFSNDILNNHKIPILIMYLKFGIRSYFDQCLKM